jgi:outer membrane protein
MKTKYAPLGLLLVALAALASLGFAQQIKIGVVNSNEVLEKSSEGKKVIAQLQQKDKQNQADIQKLDDDIRTTQTKLNTQRLTLTEEAVTQYSIQLDRLQTDRKRKAEDAVSSFNELQNRLFKKIQDELVPIVEQIGKEKGLDVIFDLFKSGAVWWNPATDITAEVIKRYDASKATGK